MSKANSSRTTYPFNLKDSLIKSLAAAIWQSKQLGYLKSVAFACLAVSLLAQDISGWQPISGVTNSNLGAVAWGNGQWVVLSDSSQVLRSENGWDWEIDTVSPGLNGVDFGNGVFVAVGDSGMIGTLDTQGVWHAPSSGTTDRLLTVTFAGGRFVAVGESDFVFVSQDGITWTSHAHSAPGTTLNNVTWDKLSFYACGDNVTLLSSSDAMTWKTEYTGTANHNLHHLLIEDTFLVAFGDAIMLRAEVEWSIESLPENPDDVILGGHALIAASDGQLYASDSGFVWVPMLNGPAGVRALGWNGRQILAVGDGGSISITNLGLDRWWTRHNSHIPTSFLDIVHAEGRWLILGDDDTFYGTRDGIKWTSQDSGFTGLNSLAYRHGRYVAVGDLGLVITSVDGRSWAAVPSTTSEQLLDVASSADDFLACGSAGTLIRSNLLGTVWNPETSETSEDLHAVAAIGAGWAGGDNGTCLVRSGSTWISEPVPSVQRINSISGESDSLIVTTEGGSILHRDQMGNWLVTYDIASQSFTHSIHRSSSGFLAIGEQGLIRTSDDGITWKPSYLIVGPHLNAAAWDGTTTMAIGVYGRFAFERPILDHAENIPNRSSHLGVIKAVGQGQQHLVAVDSANYLYRNADQAYAEPEPANVPLDPIRSMLNAGTQLYGIGGTGWYQESFPDWSVSHPFISESMRDAVWTGNFFVAVGDGGAIYKSIDGGVWTPQLSGTDVDLLGVIWDGADVYAYGKAGTLIVSADGETWSDTGQTRSNDILGLVCVDGVFVGALSNGMALRKTATTGWAGHIVDLGTPIIDIIWTGKLFLVLSQDGDLFWSYSGIFWRPLAQRGTGMLGLYWDGMTAFIYGADAAGAPRIDRIPSLYEPDPVSFQYTSPFPFYPIVATCPFRSDWISADSYGNIFGLKLNRHYTWIDQLPSELTGLASSGSKLVAVGVGGAIYSSDDGYQWTYSNSGTTSALRAASWWRDQFLVLGDSGTILTSPDGSVWAPQSSGTTENLQALDGHGERMVAVGDGGILLTTTNGTVWSPVVVPNIASNFTAVLWTGNEFLAGDDAGSLIVSDSGSTWESVSTELPGAIVDMATNGHTNIIVSEEGIAFGDVGANWHILPTFNASGSTLATYEATIFIFGQSGRYEWRPMHHLQQSAPISIEAPNTVCHSDTWAATVVTETPTELLGFQWFHDGEILIGENQPDLTITDFGPDDEGQYYCWVTNGTSSRTQFTSVSLESLFIADIEHPTYVQGLDDIVLLAAINCDLNPLAMTWHDLSSGSLLAQNVNPLVGSFTETLQVQFETTDLTTLQMASDSAWVLVSQNPLHRDYNGDGCNNLLDLWGYAEKWRQFDPQDADGDSIVTVLDLMYLNLDHPTPCL